MCSLIKNDYILRGKTSVTFQIKFFHGELKKHIIFTQIPH